MERLRFIIFPLLCCLAFLPLAGHAQTALQEYHYDSLGRLVQVKENTEVKVEYCYDKAGNRTAVQAGSGGCPKGNELLPSPTGLKVGTHSGNGYIINWNPTPGATYYLIKCGLSTVHTVRGGSTREFATGANTARDAPKHIQACNDSVCSLRAYF